MTNLWIDILTRNINHSCDSHFSNYKKQKKNNYNKKLQQYNISKDKKKQYKQKIQYYIQ